MNIKQRLTDAGFTIWSTGGGFYAYAKTLADGNVLMVCDNSNQVDELSDADFIVSLQDDGGSPLAEFVKNGNTLEYIDHVNTAQVSRDNNGATLEAALSVFGVTL